MALQLDIHQRETQKPGRLLMILIHGLGVPETWIHDDGNWKDMILGDSSLDGVDVGVVRYDTSHLISGIFGIVGNFKIFNREVTVTKDSPTSISLLAQELKREMDSRAVRKYEKVVLIGHSMGGLIGIHYLLKEIDHSQPFNLGGYISVCTPFNGSSFAEFHQVIKKVQQHEQIEQLRPNSEFLDDLIRMWNTHQQSAVLNDIRPVFCFGIDDPIVSKESAIPHVVTSKWLATPLPGDHGSVLDISNGENATYRTIRDYILDVVDLLASNGNLDTGIKVPENKKIIQGDFGNPKLSQRLN